MPKKLIILLNVILLIVSGCGKDLPTLEGVDLQTWKDDKDGCRGARAGMADALRKEHTKLKGLSEMDMVKLLGKPDQNELYKRNQKFFHYSINRGRGCDAPDSVALQLIIRFNAMGNAQLVSVE